MHGQLMRCLLPSLPCWNNRTILVRIRILHHLKKAYQYKNNPNVTVAIKALAEKTDKGNYKIGISVSVDYIDKEFTVMVNVYSRSNLSFNASNLLYTSAVNPETEEVYTTCSTAQCAIDELYEIYGN